jgi:hypothetical protein
MVSVNSAETVMAPNVAYCGGSVAFSHWMSFLLGFGCFSLEAFFRRFIHCSLVQCGTSGTVLVTTAGVGGSTFPSCPAYSFTESGRKSLDV